jgi:hypothetical protein
MSEYTYNAEEFRLDENDGKNESKDIPPPSEISTSRKHSVDYFTKDGLILRTGYSNIQDWYLLPIKEGLDNGIDFGWKSCRGENISIDVEIYKNDQIFRLKIRNPNPNDIPVFEDLDAIFDYEMRYGSKQDVHTISRGMLGDAMKQILSLGYILIHFNDDGTEFADKQWDYPLIIRHNRVESRIFLHYDKAKQEPGLRFEIGSEFGNVSTDTEIEVVLPVIDQVRSTLNRSYIERFCREYSILTTDISFNLRILDESTYAAQEDHSNANPADIRAELKKTLSTAPPKGIVNIEIPALSPIAYSKEWSNADSIHSYSPTEFTSRITNVHQKQKTSVYEVLQNFREGTNLKKSNNTERLVADLISDPNMYCEIEQLYKELKSVLPPSRKISLPYTTNRKERMNTLVPRIAEIYNIDKAKQPSYRIEYGYFDDGVVQYPFAVEILGIPLANPIEVETKFIGAINYSISPNGIRFEGEYHIDQGEVAKNVNEVLRLCGFNKYSAKKSRLPCIVIGNLITPRRDPHGYAKSRIDTKPFAQTIAVAVKKMASEIQTFRAAGYIMRAKDEDYRNARKKKINRKVSAKALLRQFLVTERGLPDV